LKFLILSYRDTTGADPYFIDGKDTGKRFIRKKDAEKYLKQLRQNKDLESQKF